MLCNKRASIRECIRIHSRATRKAQTSSYSLPLSEPLCFYTDSSSSPSSFFNIQR